jgi:PAS domain S-box-containing protein
MRQEPFVRQLRAVRDHSDRLQRRMADAGDPVLAEVLTELGTALEELRVTEEQLRSDDIYVSTVQRDRERYRRLFEEAPAAYLVTDRDGVVRQANLRASALLGVDQQWLAGKPLVSFVQLEDRKAFRRRLLLPDSLDRAEWEAWLQPRHGGPVLVRALVSRLRNDDDGPWALAWLLRELPESASGLAGLLSAVGGQLGDGPGRPDWEALSATLQEVAESAVAVLGTDSAGLMLADPQGRLGWVTATDEPGRAFEQAQQDLQEGPCVAAMAGNVLVATPDVRGDQQWLRLASVAAAHSVRAVLAAPVTIDGRAVGTCNAISHTPRQWSATDVRAMRAFASVLARLLAQAGEARQQAEMVAQLRQALDSRVAIEQAKGVLMARLRVDEQAAFERLRQIARSSSRRVVDVAREVVADRLHISAARPPVAAQQDPAEPG